jgi:MinD-like ATPase involved in chromosome partitioning or flagellar assembly
MDQIEFADGFDRPDTIAFGLGAGQLAVVMVGALVAYSLVRSPLPPAISDPVAAVLAVGAAGLGWLRIAGRPALDWAVFAGLFSTRPRRGTVRWELAAASGADGAAPREAEAPRASILELFGKPTPRASDPNTSPPTRGQKTRSAQPPGDPNRSRVMRPTSRADGARRVTFFSLRGGTGRSTLATELTCLLAASQSEQHAAPKVALVDLDLRSPSVAVRLGAPELTLLDFALAAPEDRSVIDFMVRHASGAHVLLGPQRAVNPEWPVTPALLREVLRELDMEGFDLVVLDVCPELNPLTTTAICACDDVFIVVVPTAGGVQDAYRSTEALRRLGLRHQLRYIVNRSRPGTDLSEPMADLGGQLIGDIPDDEAVVTAENTHRLVGLNESGPAAIALRRLARRIGSELHSAWPA